MRYFYEPTSGHDHNYFQLYSYDHPLFDLCTLYLQDELGLIVIQQHYDQANKTVSWGPVEPNLANDIFICPEFRQYFITHADHALSDGYYPVVSVRKLMWALRMKPLRRGDWEQELQRL